MNLMSEKEYRARVDRLAETKNFSFVGDDFFKELDNLTEDLRDMIVFNADEFKTDGTAYYVSNGGDDNNDGLSPTTAWKTLEKANSFTYKNGDAVLFERGGLWRGEIVAQSGVSYSAYGVGAKPKIYKAFDGKDGNWVKTEYENVWKFDKSIEVSDIGSVVFNDGEAYADKKYEFDELNSNYQFRFIGTDYKENQENILYLYCDKGNPSDVFRNIDLSYRKDFGSIIKIPHFAENIYIKNLDLRYGMDIFFPMGAKNIVISYCVCGWQGGHIVGGKRLRYGGGGGCWHSCDNMRYEHCYIYQQFDAGVDPQYHWIEDTPAIINGFVTTDCLFETCEYTFEFFNTQDNLDGNCFSNCYIGYNLCRNGGRGFGDKHTGSAYIKLWQNHENHTKNFVFEKNIFDRAYSRTLILGARETSGGKFSLKYIPKLKGNIYIDRYNKPFAVLNYVDYRYNEDSYKEFEDLGVSKNETYLFTR